MSRSDIDDIAHVAAAETHEVRQDFRQTLLAGLTLTIPLFITLLVLLWVLGVVANVISPLTGLLDALGLTAGLSSLVTEVVAVAIVFGIVFAVGLSAQHGPDTQLWGRVDALMEDLPGVGSIYTSVERMSDVVVDGDTESFREVKLVEFPREESFAIAFLTADAPDPIETAAGYDEMQTLFVPMAPNPVMGGHLLSLPRDRIHDVDLTVEEGMQAIMTTGVAIDESAFHGGEGTPETT